MRIDKFSFVCKIVMCILINLLEIIMLKESSLLLHGA
jgi:hypothetical protein